MSTDSLESLRSHLRTLFQFDVADLDFGIYRILNEKRDDIERFIEEDLVEGVREELRAYEEGQAEALREEVDEARQAVLRNISEDAIQPDGTVKEEYQSTKAAQDYIKAQERLEAAELSDETERRIYDDLARFFNRYYDNGDFVTKRRFAAGNSKYVVPYDGEEVLLHWANRDQYYVKTTEHFRDYRFTARDVSVHFKLVDAQTPQDNVKASDTRYFVLQGEDSNDEKNWSQGVDVEWLGQRMAEKDNQAIKDFMYGMNNVFKRLLLYPVPVIAAISGHAFGNGAILSCACDFRFMRADRGFFCFPEVDLGIPFLPGMIAFVKKSLPYYKFNELKLTGRRATAAELEEHNIIIKSCADVDELMKESVNFAKTFQKKRGIFGEHKKRLHKHIVQIMENEDPEFIESLFLFIQD